MTIKYSDIDRAAERAALAGAAPSTWTFLSPKEKIDFVRVYAEAASEGLDYFVLSVHDFSTRKENAPEPRSAVLVFRDIGFFRDIFAGRVVKFVPNGFAYDGGFRFGTVPGWACAGNISPSAGLNEIASAITRASRVDQKRTVVQGGKLPPAVRLARPTATLTIGGVPQPVNTVVVRNHEPIQPFRPGSFEIDFTYRPASTPGFPNSRR